MEEKKWKKYTLEFLSIFIAVVSAFALNNWNENRNNRHSEEKILTEIKNSIRTDIKDFKNNIHGNEVSLKADSVFRGMINGHKASQDSIGFYYTLLFRDYIPIINRSAYESLKANNLKTISTDSLRLQIITLYDYYYSIIEKLEYDVPEMKSYKNYFSRVNTIIHPYMEFDEAGRLIGIDNLDQLEAEEKKEILSYLWRVRNNRKFKLARYDLIIEVIHKVEKNITASLDQ